MKKNYLKLFLALLVCQLAGLIGGLFNMKSLNDWYPTLIKPSFNPPGWLFAPVWIILFVLMGLAVYLILVSQNKNKKFAIFVFGVQLILNIFWSMFFFYLQSPLAAFIEIICLLVMILVTMYYFYKINKVAMYLLLPYLFWVSFASILNFSIWILNK